MDEVFSQYLNSSELGNIPDNSGGFVDVVFILLKVLEVGDDILYRTSRGLDVDIPF